MKTFIDHGVRVFDFIGEMWVKCPKCGQCAIIRHKEGETGQFAKRRVACAACPYVEDWAERGMSFPWYSMPVDPCFGLPLWLQQPCCGEILWAYNPDHLSFVKEYVGARHRTRRENPEFGWNNRSLASRLPKWMQIAKNREAVLRAITRLEDAIPKVRASR